MSEPSAPDAAAARRRLDVDFWSFVDRARVELRDHHGYDAHATEVLLVLNRASGIVTYDLEASVHRPRGRSWASFRLLYVLWLVGPLESRRLAELTGQTRQAVSNLTGSLVDEGLVERRSDPEDGRAVILALTDAGGGAIADLFRAQHAREQEWVDILSPEEQRTLVRLLDKLVRARDFGPATRS